MSQKQFVRIYFTLVRHGLTDGNVKVMIHGSTDDPLNATGLQQAVAVGDRLKDEKFIRVWASDLKRAYVTATSIVERNKHFMNVKDIETDVLLRERHCGDHEGQPFSKYIKDYYQPGFRPPNGETIKDVLIRVEKFMEKTLKELAKLEDESHVLVVTHGGVMTEFTKYFQDNKIIGIEDVKEIPNAAVSQFLLSIDKETCQISSGQCCFLYNGDHLEVKTSVDINALLK